MTIKLSQVTDDLKNILTISDSERSEYKEFLAAFNWYKQTEIPEGVKTGNKEALLKMFEQIFSSFLAEAGFCPDVWGRSNDKQIFLREWEDIPAYIEYYCKGVKIIEGRDTYLDGFVPILRFFIDTDISSEISLICKIEGEGCWQSVLLIKPSLLYSRISNSRNKIPELKIKPVEKDFLISPIISISNFLQTMKSLAEFLGEKGIGKLVEADGVIKKAPESLKEAAKDRYARTLLELLGYEL